MPAQGKVVQVIGPVVDVEFPPDQLPQIYNAIEIEADATVTGTGSKDGQNAKIVLEAQQELGNTWIRCVAMSSTDGVRRGTATGDTGKPITIPVGEGSLGRILNVLGQPIDMKGPIQSSTEYPIHRKPPSLEDQETQPRIFE